MKQAVFLDRDGVINKAIIRESRPYAPNCLEEVEYLPGVAEAIGTLKRAAFRIIVVTNQPDVATGKVRRGTVEAIHERLLCSFPIDDIKVCYHSDADACQCRKPKAGMLLEAAREWSLDLGRCFMVGDRWRDIGAGKAAGCRTILVGDGYGDLRGEVPDARADSLLEASQLILGEKHWGSRGELWRI